MLKEQFSKESIKFIEQKYKQSTKKHIKVGDFLKVEYKNLESGKERIQFYTGIVISIQNNGLGKSFTIRRKINGIGIENIFLYNSPKLISIIIEDSIKIRRSKLYYTRFIIKKKKLKKFQFF